MFRQNRSIAGVRLFIYNNKPEEIEKVKIQISDIDGLDRSYGIVTKGLCTVTGPETFEIHEGDYIEYSLGGSYIFDPKIDTEVYCISFTEDHRITCIDDIVIEEDYMTLEPISDCVLIVGDGHLNGDPVIRYKLMKLDDKNHKLSGSFRVVYFNVDKEPVL